MPYELHQLGVKVELADGDKINDADGDALAQQCGAFGDEGLPRLGAILVRRTDQFDGGGCPPQTGLFVITKEAGLHVAFG